MAPLVDHLERFLGPIQAGHRFEPTRGPRINVARFAPQDLPGINVLATIGLSLYRLGSTEPGMRHELVMAGHSHLTDRVPGFLHQIAEECIDKEEPLERGQIIGPRDTAFPPKLTALYATDPDFVPDDSFREIDGTTIIWLVPIMTSEAHYRRRHGPAAFETALKRSHIDLFDLTRETGVSETNEH